jgi:D-alanyl-D-alanine carboxypeptidase
MKLVSRAAMQFIALLTVAAVTLGSISPAFARQKFAAITIDARNGNILYSDDPDGRRYPASLTKVMTLYVLFQDLKAGRIRLNTPLRVSARAASMSPTKLGVRPGTTVTVEIAIKALIIQSANDVAVVVAENLGGTESNFAARMTRVARTIGMKNSTYMNASGLPNARQVTTARDQATLALRIMRDFPQYYPFFRSQSFTYRGRTIRTHNQLVKNYAGTDGIKTGFTNAAGYNLTTSTRRGEKRLVGVVLGARSSGRRSVFMRNMLEKAFPKASGGTTIAALAGSSRGVVDPIKLMKRKPRIMNAAASEVTGSVDQTELADVAADVSQNPDANLVQSEPTVVQANLAGASNAAWKIQVGAFPTKENALAKIRDLQAANLDALADKQAFTVSFEKGENVIYRARFGGFDKASAKTACRELSRKGMTCLAIAPQS